MNRSLFIASIMSFILLSSAVVASAATINVQQLNQRLIKENAEWVARDNWVNQLPREDVKRMLGLRKAPTADIEFVEPISMQTKDQYPTALDWRNKDGKNWVSPILNQANCGSCVAFAAIGVMETQFNIASSFSGLNLRLSPQNLFACGGGGCETGWWPESAASRLMRSGVPDEACMPYQSGATGHDMACSASCADTSKRSRRISNFRTPTRSMTSIASVKKALQSGPVMTTLTVYADFLSYGGGVYKHTSGSALGGHAISIVGYNDNERSFIIRNSWGEDWGEKGFGRVSYDDASGVGSETWGFDIPALGGAVSILTPRDYTYTTGQTEFSLQSTYSTTDSMAVTVYDAHGVAVWAATCGGSSCASKMDSSQLADGRYEVQATALGAKGDKIDQSTRQFFYVVNQKPQLAVSFAGLNVDLNKDLSDRIEFDITTSSSSVPMSSLEFHYKDSAGIEKVRTAEVVLSRMAMGWRTNLLPNGEYEIWMVGRLKSSALDIGVETAHRQVRLRN